MLGLQGMQCTPAMIYSYVEVRKILRIIMTTFLNFEYRNSANSFRRNYSFLNLEIVENSNFNFLSNKLNFCWGNYSRKYGTFNEVFNRFLCNKSNDNTNFGSVYN